MKNILVTGGAGYIGSHMVYYLIEKGINPIILDNFSNSDDSRIREIENLLNKKITVLNFDIIEDLDKLKIKDKIDGVIHFAAFKSVPESIQKPKAYYENNVFGTLNVIRWAIKNKVKNFVYSSSSSVYGDTLNVPIIENEICNPITPYAKSKLFSEEIIKDVCKNGNLNAVSLRYFNVAGNISSGFFGDTPDSPAIIPAILRSFFAKDINLEIYGNDYDTSDGFVVRDFIHVLDLVEAHFKSLEFLLNNKGFHVFNIGSEKGYTLFELIKTFEKITKKNLDYTVCDRKEGDIAVSIADCSKANKELDWRAKRDLKDIFSSMLNYYEYRKFW